MSEVCDEVIGRGETVKLNYKLTTEADGDLDLDGVDSVRFVVFNRHDKSKVLEIVREDLPEEGNEVLFTLSSSDTDLRKGLYDYQVGVKMIGADKYVPTGKATLTVLDRLEVSN